MEGTEITKEGEYTLHTYTGLSDNEIRLKCLELAQTIKTPVIQHALGATGQNPFEKEISVGANDRIGVNLPPGASIKGMERGSDEILKDADAFSNFVLNIKS